MKNILVIRFSSLGDLITQDVAYRAIRHFYHSDHIVFLTSKIGIEVYAESNYFNDFIVNDGFDIDTIIALRRNSFDLIFDMQCSSMSLFLTFFCKYQKCFRQSGGWLKKIFNIKSQTKWYPELVCLSGIEKPAVDSYAQDSENKIIKLEHVKKAYDWKSEQIKTIAIAPGASERWDSKRWGDKNFAKLTNELIGAGFQVVLVGSKLEEGVGAFIMIQNPKVINLIAKTTVSELKSVLANMDLLVCNDSGPAHLAAGVGTNTLTIFGSTDIKHCAKFGNYSGEHDFCLAYPKLPCQPCYEPVCPTNKECMDAVSVDMVFQKILEFTMENDNA